ncbi:MAG: TonB-dependent receptor [Sphingomonadales bacterium]|nr:TonB-dependent receptor [Sphingomonadales bacterium]
MLSFARTATAVRLLAGASALAVAMPALAQEAPQDGAVQLDEIVVSAQKREENLQDVPLSITALSGAKLEKLDVKDARDLSGLAPNVTITQGTTSNNAAIISIRGIPTPGSETFGLDTANGLYVDGVYIARSGGAALDVMDIARVEVLRGPQGTLFGRNTTGGGIAFISRAPSREFRLKADAGYGNYNAWNGRITLDPGEIAGIATSFTYAHRERHGVVDNILQSDRSRDPGGRKSDAVRFAARAELGGTGSIQYIFDWNRTVGAPTNFQLTNVSDGAIRTPVSVGGQSLLLTQPAPVQQYLAAATFLNPACAALAAPTRVWRDTVCNDISSLSTEKTWGNNLQVQNDFGAFKLKSTTGYRFWHDDSNTDLDGIGAFRGPAFSQATLFNGMPASLIGFIPSAAPFASFIAATPVPTVQQNLFDTNNRRRHKQFSQEIEVSGNADKFDWVVGGFYFWEKGSEFNPQNSGYVLDTNQAVFTTTSFGALAPLFQAANPARYRLVQTRAILNYTAQSESFAVYGQTTVYPAGRDSSLRLTLGGRYTWDIKNMVRLQNGTTPVATPERGHAKFNKFTWNVMVGYDLADGINAYGRVATGYRSGGFNAQDAAFGGVLPNFAPENVTSYELGLKTELFDRRVRFNVAGYHNIYKDLAVNIPLTNPPVGTFGTKVGNAGKVNYTGIEAELQAVLTDNFTVEGNIGYVDIKYKEFMAGQSLVPGSAPVNIASIATPGYVSPLTANGAINAQFPVGDAGMRLTSRVSFTYEDGKYSFNNSLSSPFNQALKGNNRATVDAQIGVEAIPVAGGEASVRLWVKNLTDQHVFARGIDFGQLGYAGGYFMDPRTYGVSVGMKF